MACSPIGSPRAASARCMRNARRARRCRRRSCSIRTRSTASIIAGGDGTLNAAASGLLKSGLPLGIVPGGTANDLARTLAIPNDVDGALDIIARREERRIDLGRVNDQLFFNVASIGLSVELARAMSSETKRRFGRLSYSLAALRVITRARPFSALIISEGEKARVKTFPSRCRQRPLLRRRQRGREIGGNRRRPARSLQPRDEHGLETRLDGALLSRRRAWRL